MSKIIELVIERNDDNLVETLEILDHLAKELSLNGDRHVAAMEDLRHTIASMMDAAKSVQD